MAKRSSSGRDVEQLLFCSGPGWEGDGSKETSRCPSNDSRRLTCSKYQCHYCAMKMDPAKTLANEKGLTEYGKAYYEQDDLRRKQMEKAGIISESQSPGEPRKTSPKAEDLPALMLAGLDQIDPKPAKSETESAEIETEQLATSAKVESKPRRVPMRARKLPRSAQ